MIYTKKVELVWYLVETTFEAALMTQISLLSVTSGAISFDLTTKSQQGHNAKDTIQSLQKECLHQRIWGFSGNFLLKQKIK